MMQIKSDPVRRIEIPGVPHPVKRPVDIDQAITGFTNLRTLRIYQFDTDSVIEGHAEEDEVFIIVLRGAIDLLIADGLLEEGSDPEVLAAPGSSREGVACAAYLPPHAAYKLVAKSDADVAYVRATPTGGRPPKAFFPTTTSESNGSHVLLEEAAYAQRLRLRLMQVATGASALSFIPVHETEGACEALVYIRSEPLRSVSTIGSYNSAPVLLESWDTVAVRPGEGLALTLASQSEALVLIVMAT